MKHGSAADRRALRVDHVGASRCRSTTPGPGIEPDAGAEAERLRPLRPAQHAAASRGDRGDPRRPPLADRRHPRRPRMAGALIGGSDGPSRSVSASSTTTRWSGRGPPRFCGRSRTSTVVGVAASLEAAREAGLTDATRRGRPAARHPARNGQRAPAPIRCRLPRRGTASGGHRPDRVRLPAVRRRRAAASARPGSCSRPRHSPSWSTRSGGSPPAVSPSRSGHGRPAVERLTAREHDVVRLVADGRSNDEIGATLGIGSKTVETHLSRIFERFGVSSRTELAARAVREGWLDVPPGG